MSYLTSSTSSKSSYIEVESFDHFRRENPEYIKVDRPTHSASSVASSAAFVLSRRTSRTSMATSISLQSDIPPVGHPNPTYRLPCDSVHTGCRCSWDSSEREHWISHSISHFKEHGPPPAAKCTFCDEVTFESNGDAIANWRARMIHIDSHFRSLQTEDDTRPDFLVIQYMYKHKLISTEDYNEAIGFSERPGGCHLDGPPQDPGDRYTKEILRFRLMVRQNTSKEDRERRRRRNKDKNPAKP